jgi:outer membrane protein assembly factor BamD (BamD/ComL family)
MPALAADKVAVAPPREHPERLTYDPKTDTWTVAGEPEPGTENGDLDIARQWLARQGYKQALDITKVWIKTYGVKAPRYPEALFIQGTSYLELSEYRAANDDFQKLLTEYPGSEYAEQALSAQFRIAEQYLAGKRRKALWGLLRVKDREGGVKIMDDIAAGYADTPLAELAAKSKADYYFARGEFDLAQDEYATFARERPTSRYHAYALLQSARASLASFPGIQFDDVGLVEAQERFTQFEREYPDVSRQQGVPVILDEIAARRADKTLEIGKFYEKTSHRFHEKAQKLQTAKYYYRQTILRYPGTAAAAQAAERLTALGETPPSVTARREDRSPRRIEAGG